MAHPASGTVIDALTSPGHEQVETTTLVRTRRMEVVRLVIAAAEDKPAYKTPGDVTIHCLEGRFNVIVDGRRHELQSGQLIYLGASIPHSLHGIDPSVALLTIVPADTDSSSEELMLAAADPTDLEDVEFFETSPGDPAVGRGARG